MITDYNYWLVLAISLPIYWSMPSRFRMLFLTAVSFAYLATLELFGMLYLAATSLCFYSFSHLLRSRPSVSWLLPILITSTLGYLAYFKYMPRIIVAFKDEPVLHKIFVPLGLSYYTFKLIHYAIESARGNIKTHSLSDFCCYIFLVPIFTAGPIERFDHFLDNRGESCNSEDVVIGLTRITHGLIKKLVFAQLVLVPFFGGVTNGTLLLERLADLPTYKVWGFCILSFTYMYLDFSAYSDIAIGTSRLFGIKIMENFNWPIFSENISIFWKKWHMTLAGWCQSYVYLPVIGLTRNPYLATYLTFCAIGLWHSGSLGWLAWGLYHATGISIYGSWNRYRRKRKWRGLDRPFGRLVGIPLTMLFVSAGSALTAIDGVGGLYEMLRVISKLFFVNIPV